MSMPKNHATVWVCLDCIMHHVNGECGNCHTDEGHDREPLALVRGNQPAKGMYSEEHSEDCLVRSNPTTVCYDCDCETNPFSWFSCEGCGSNLGGERHAMTIWWD